MAPSRNHNYADDSLRFAFELTNAHGVIVTHHLYLNAMRALWRVLDRAHPGVDPVRLLSLYASLTGALALAFLFRLMQRLGLGDQTRAGVLLCGASAGFWSYAIVGDVYVPALSFLIIGTDFAIAALQAADPGGERRSSAAAVAAFTLAILHHQAEAVFVTALGLGMLLVTAIPLRRRLRLAVTVPVATGLFSLCAYAAVYATFSEEHVRSFTAFLSGYGASYTPLPDMKRLSPGTLLNAAAGATRALVSTNALFRDPGFVHAIQTRFPYRNVYPYSYLVRHLPLPVAHGLVLVATASAVATFGLAVLGIWKWLSQGGLGIVLVPAAIAQALFFTWWEAISDEFWIWSLPFIAIAAVAGASHGRGAARALRAAAVGVALTTLIGSVALFWSDSNDLDAVNDRYLREAAREDLVIGFDEIQSEARTRLELRRRGYHYFNVYTRSPEWSASDSLALETEITGALARRGRIFVDPYLSHPPRSNLAHIGLKNPGFDRQRLEWIERLRSLDRTRVVWVPLVAESPGDFR